MKKYRLQVGLDVDDILYECNGYALELLNRAEGYEPPLSIYDIHGWGADDSAVGKRIRYFSDPEFVASQPILPGAKEFVRELARVADVFFVSAVPPACMSARAMRLAEDFPEVPTNHILLGHRKDLVHLDILLDDGAHNISHSPAVYPVLFRKPWNMHLSGLLSVTTYRDFLLLVEMIRHAFANDRPNLSGGGVIGLVGPTATRKNKLAKALVEGFGMVKPVTATTRPRRADEGAGEYRFLDEATFLAENAAGRYLETTVYSGYYFGTVAEDIDRVVRGGGVAVLPIDICGALSIKNRYRDKALLVFLRRRRADVIYDIISGSLETADKACRILSLDDEYRNEELCDLTLDANCPVSQMAALLAEKVGKGPVIGE